MSSLLKLFIIVNFALDKLYAASKFSLVFAISCNIPPFFGLIVDVLVLDIDQICFSLSATGGLSKSLGSFPNFLF